jgi:spore germination cell wall hydrolase CwlJ-like protein
VRRNHAISKTAARLAAAVSALIALTACSGRKPPARAQLASARLSVLRTATLTMAPAAAGPINALPPAQVMRATGAEAEAMNAERPFDNTPIEPMRPFVLKTDAADQTRAVHCLAQAVYYEAAREPLRGQEAVAQVVLNRLRHPAYPKSVCGVVYQGAELPTGCQFTFTCNGAVRQAPEPALWDRAIFVARQALGGFVDRDVGSATHYHAAYVAPYWAPTLVKMTQVGQHIFYRWTGTWGEPQAFTGRYEGREAALTRAVLQSTPQLEPQETAPIERKVALVQNGEARVYRIADPGQTTGDAAAEVGVLHASRRQPTRDEVQAINARLAEMEARRNAPAAASAAQAGQPAAADVGTPAGN